MKNDLIQWLGELKTTKRDYYKTEEVISRLESIVWEQVKIHDTPTGNPLDNYERKALCWRALWKCAMKSSDDELLKMLTEIEEIVEKEQVNYNIQGLYPTPKYIDTDMLEEETYIHKKELNRKYGNMQKEQMKQYIEDKKD